MRKITFILILGFVFGQTPDNYEDLQTLFKDWRAFESPPLLNGAPDYTKRQFKKRQRPFKALQKRLAKIDTTGWPVSMQVDWQIVEAEMNGYDFNRRVQIGRAHV